MEQLYIEQMQQDELAGKDSEHLRGWITGNESLVSQTQSLKFKKGHNDSDGDFTGKMIPPHFPVVQNSQSYSKSKK